MMTYLEGRSTALQSAIAAAATSAGGDGFWAGGDDGRESNHWQEEGRCADEHFD